MDGTTMQPSMNPTNEFESTVLYMWRDVHAMDLPHITVLDVFLPMQRPSRLTAPPKYSRPEAKVSLQLA